MLFVLLFFFRQKFFDVICAMVKKLKPFKMRAMEKLVALWRCNLFCFLAEFKEVKITANTTEGEVILMRF